MANGVNKRPRVPTLFAKELIAKELKTRCPRRLTGLATLTEPHHVTLKSP
jgi:hypothetical protein